MKYGVGRAFTAPPGTTTPAELDLPEDVTLRDLRRLLHLDDIDPLGRWSMRRRKKGAEIDVLMDGEPFFLLVWQAGKV